MLTKALISSRSSPEFFPASYQLTGLKSTRFIRADRSLLLPQAELDAHGDGGAPRMLPEAGQVRGAHFNQVDRKPAGAGGIVVHAAADEPGVTLRHRARGRHVTHDSDRPRQVRLESVFRELRFRDQTAERKPPVKARAVELQIIPRSE